MKKGFSVMYVILALLVAVKLFFGGTDLAALAVFLWSAGLSVFLLIKNGLPRKGHLAVSAALTLAVLAVMLLGGRNNLFGLLLFTLTTLLSSAAVMSVSEKHDAVRLLRSPDAKGTAVSMLAGAAVSVPLILINTLLMKGSTDMAVHFGIDRLLWAVQPGIAEEMCFRAVFMAMCVYLANGSMTKGQYAGMYVLMTLPHGLWHPMDLIGCLVSAVIFGLPLALLQEKRDMTSAITAHFLIDAARFIIFGT